MSDGVRKLSSDHTGGGEKALTAAYREDIDGLRAIAVLSVTGFHFEAPRIFDGFVGVDIFFVISGYLPWGDSLAAHYLVGFRARTSPQRVNIMQTTWAACRPMPMRRALWPAAALPER